MFQFKQFSVRQERCPMKVGTDGVLLGAWATVLTSDRRILDIGTGTGLIALMLAQRAPCAAITGIDIGDVDEALANAADSPWSDRVAIVRCAAQEFDPTRETPAPATPAREISARETRTPATLDPEAPAREIPPARFDLIVSNPPFFIDSLPSPDAARTAARHAVSLSYEELCDAAVRLLAPDGRFAVILPADHAARFLNICAGRLVLVRRTDVRTTPRTAPKRTLMELTAATTAPASTAAANPAAITAPAPAAACSELIIGTGVHECYTAEYRALTHDFYLKF